MGAQEEIARLTAQMQALGAGQPFASAGNQSPQGGPWPPKPPEPITPDQITAIIDSSLKRAMPQLMGMVQLLDDFFTKALPPEELAAFKKYRDAGAPGLKELIAADTLHPVAQLLWDEIKSNAIVKKEGDQS